MDKLISEMRDHYIICGYGRMGKQVATDLRQHNVPVVVIEDNPVHIPELIEQGIPYIEGKATEDKILIAAGAERAKGIVAEALMKKTYLLLYSPSVEPKPVYCSKVDS